jgi:hypothetical protein
VASPATTAMLPSQQASKTPPQFISHLLHLAILLAPLTCRPAAGKRQGWRWPGMSWRLLGTRGWRHCPSLPQVSKHQGRLHVCCVRSGEAEGPTGLRTSKAIREEDKEDGGSLHTCRADKAVVEDAAKRGHSNKCTAAYASPPRGQHGLYPFPSPHASGIQLADPKEWPSCPRPCVQPDSHTRPWPCCRRPRWSSTGTVSRRACGRPNQSPVRMLEPPTEPGGGDRGTHLLSCTRDSTKRQRQAKTPPDQPRNAE